MWYLLHKGIARKFVDSKDIKHFLFEEPDKPNNRLYLTPTLLTTYKLGPDIPAINLIDLSPDERTRLEMTKIAAVYPNNFHLIESLNTICINCKNPAIFQWPGESHGALMFCGEFLRQAKQLPPTVSGSTLFIFQLNNPAVATFIQSSFEASDVFPLTNGSYVTLDGVDCRLQALSANDGVKRLAVSYALQAGVTSAQSYGEISSLSSLTTAQDQSQTQQELRVDRHFKYVRAEGEGNVVVGGEKNYVPFLYRDTLHLIKHINPMTVVTLGNEVPGQNQINYQVVSTVNKVDLWWRFGELRGGTNALDLGDRYLAFFHSEMKLHPNPLRTYFMGAYTFSHEPPFRLLSVSAEPIVHESFYVGPWITRVYRSQTDYCVYPMQIYFVAGRRAVNISMGRQDSYGVQGTIWLADLFESMEEVIYENT